MLIQVVAGCFEMSGIHAAACVGFQRFLCTKEDQISKALEGSKEFSLRADGGKSASGKANEQQSAMEKL